MKERQKGGKKKGTGEGEPTGREEGYEKINVSSSAWFLLGENILLSVILYYIPEDNIQNTQ